jgi:hypothetical protein
MQTHRYATVLADEAEAVSASGLAIFVGPNKRGDGFRASILGHMFELADPDVSRGLVPTPTDLLTVAIAADVAWFARRFLRARGVPDYVGVSARPGTREPQAGPGDVEVTVDVSKDAEAVCTALAAALERRLVALSSLSARLHVSPA